VLSLQASMDGSNTRQEKQNLDKYESSINTISNNYNIMRQKQNNLINKLQK
jgi:hypothetical protein